MEVYPDPGIPQRTLRFWILDELKALGRQSGSMDVSALNFNNSIWIFHEPIILPNEVPGYTGCKACNAVEKPFKYGAVSPYAYSRALAKRALDQEIVLHTKNCGLYGTWLLPVQEFAPLGCGEGLSTRPSAPLESMARNT